MGIRLFFGLLTLMAVGVQYAHLLWTIPNYNSVNYFSFFTIESNILAGTILIVTAFLIRKKKYVDDLQLWRGAATLYMVMTGLVYVTLLASADVDVPIAWVNAILHYIMPVAMVADWLLARPRKPIAFRRALVWLVFPIVYLGYSLVRGYFADWYPYPFLDPTDDGYGSVAIMSIAIALMACGLAWVLARVARQRPA